MNDICDEDSLALQEFADLQGGALGEACKLILLLVGFEDYVSPEFHTALLKEMAAQLAFFRTHARVTETRTVTYTEYDIYGNDPFDFEGFARLGGGRVG